MTATPAGVAAIPTGSLPHSMPPHAPAMPPRTCLALAQCWRTLCRRAGFEPPEARIDTTATDASTEAAPRILHRSDACAMRLCFVMPLVVRQRSAARRAQRAFYAGVRGRWVGLNSGGLLLPPLLNALEASQRA